jgi:hypothetical protein
MLIDAKCNGSAIYAWYELLEDLHFPSVSDLAFGTFADPNSLHDAAVVFMRVCSRRNAEKDVFIFKRHMVFALSYYLRL